MVLRGYGGNPGVSPRVVTPVSDVSVVGDEALLIVQRTGCPCVVHSNRALAAEVLVDEFPVDIVISDDGLQHYALGRDLEVVLYDTSLGFANGRCLPAGPLREPLSRLLEADFVLGRGQDPESADVLLSATHLVNLRTGAIVMPGELASRSRLLAIAGIARPAQFADTLSAMGLSCEMRSYPDHHVYTATDVSRWEGHTVIMTEKDAVKLRNQVNGDAWYVPLDVALPEALVGRSVALATGAAGAG